MKKMHKKVYDRQQARLKKLFLIERTVDKYLYRDAPLRDIMHEIIMILNKPEEIK